LRVAPVFEPDCQLSGRITSAGDAVTAIVQWSPVKSLWFWGMLGCWLILGYIYLTPGAVLLFLLTSAITLCGGHSLGMHRCLIHRSFDCPLWLERTGVYMGTLVGLGGPFTMMRTHDMRDWAQRQPVSHDYFGHRRNAVTDFWWQVNCEIKLVSPPVYSFPDALNDSLFFRTLQSTSMVQQLPWALIFLALGGWGWVAWGVCGRVTVSIFGHWLIGHFAHGNLGDEENNQIGNFWRIDGASVQGRNVEFCGLITFGECWHNNHHAFPGSARIGLLRGQFDPGWWTLLALKRLGLVWNIRLPDDLLPRATLSERIASRRD
jgi:stearoyl-CoA desaturase (delta-9 desaturase)